MTFPSSLEEVAQLAEQLLPLDELHAITVRSASGAGNQPCLKVMGGRRGTYHQRIVIPYRVCLRSIIIVIRSAQAILGEV
jgi:hypothetical protein